MKGGSTKNKQENMPANIFANKRMLNESGRIIKELIQL